VAKETKRITLCGTRDHRVKQVLAKVTSRFVTSSVYCESQVPFHDTEPRLGPQEVLEF